jgi:hypothetical protein
MSNIVVSQTVDLLWSDMVKRGPISSAAQTEINSALGAGDFLKPQQENTMSKKSKGKGKGGRC